MRVSKLVLTLSAVLVFAGLAACSHQQKSTSTTATSTQGDGSAQGGASSSGTRSACAVLPASEVQRILGASIKGAESSVASPDGTPNSTCTYADNTVLTIEFPTSSSAADAVMKQLQEVVTASAGKQLVGRKGDVIISVYSPSGKSKAIYDAAMSNL